MKELALFRDGNDGRRRRRRQTVLGPELRFVRARRRHGPDTAQEAHCENRPRPDSAAHRSLFSGAYSGRRFQPVIIDAKLSQPCSATMMRWPGMNARNPHIARKWSSLAVWYPPNSQATAESCTGLYITNPVNSDTAPRPIVAV